MLRQSHGQLQVQSVPVNILKHEPILLESFQRCIQLVHVHEVDRRAVVPDAGETEVHSAPAHPEVHLEGELHKSSLSQSRRTFH